ncbi:MAG: YraN family protein [Symbiobacteriia bacterium]
MSAEGRARLGLEGEELAAAYLMAQGYRLLARNYRCRFGELDLVAVDQGEVVFVEVKTRRSQAFGTSAEAVSAQKQARLLRLADRFLQERGLFDAACRFDVVAVDASVTPPRLELIRGAFIA